MWTETSGRSVGLVADQFISLLDSTLEYFLHHVDTWMEIFAWGAHTVPIALPNNDNEYIETDVPRHNRSARLRSRK